MSGAHKDHGEHCDGCILLGYVDRAEKAEAALAAVAEREWAERFLKEWSRPYFGPDVRDAVACVMRAAKVATAAPVSLADVRAECPTCGGDDPLKHPMVGGEVSLCRDSWHTPREYPSGRPAAHRGGDLS